MPKSVQWEEIREEYETIGTNAKVLSLKFRVSSEAVYSHIKAEGWQRATIDKTDKEEDIVTYEVSDDELAMLTYENATNEAKRIIGRLLKELDQNTAQIGEIERLIKEETLGDRDFRRRRLLKFVSSLSSRTIMVKNLAQAIRTLHDIEKEQDQMRKGKKSMMIDAARSIDDDDKFIAGPPPKIAA